MRQYEARRGGQHLVASLDAGGSVCDDEMINAVLLPALVIVLCTEGFFLAIADRFDAVSRNSLLHQRLLG